MSPPPRVVIVTGKSRPHQVGLLFWATLFGLMYTLGAPGPRSLDASPPWVTTVWGYGLLLGGLVGLIGCYWRGHIETGLLLESGGQLVTAGVLLIPLFGAFIAGGASALFVGGLFATWSIMNLCRAGQIHRDIKALRAVDDA